MTLSTTPASLKQLRRTAPAFQQTFLTPHADLKRFASTIVSAAECQEAGLTVTQSVFEPTHLFDLLSRYSIPRQPGQGLSLTAAGPDEADQLLHAALSDTIDFLFIPKPKSFVIYADHDEFTTFFAHTRSNLNLVTKALSSQGVKVQDYERRL